MQWILLMVLAFGMVTGPSRPVLPPDRGAFVTTLGRDTMAVERFTRFADSLIGQVVQTSPRVTLSTYRVSFGPNGIPSAFTLNQRIANDTLPPLVLRVTFGTDSIRSTRSQGTKSKYDAAPAEPAVYPEILYFWALYESETRAMAQHGATGDSAIYRMISTGGAKPYTTVFNRRASDTLSTQWFYPEYWKNYVVDASGKLLAVDGSHTTVKVRVSREPDFALETFLASAAAHERTAGAVGAMSRPDSVTTADGDVTIAVAYSRPAARGRKIWGDVVPYGTVWRTGANAATRLHLTGPVEIGGTTVPPGSYTMFSLPSADGALLIINKQVGQWGTEYHQDRDVARIPMHTEHLATPTELFTIRFAPHGTGSQDLILEWDDVRWTVPLRVTIRN